MKVHDALAHLFRKEGVTDVFGLMGNTTMDWWVAMQRIGVRMHTTRHEGPAVTMALGWTRAAGSPGVACVSRGPGLTQTATALTVAARSRAPIVVYTGDSDTGDELEDQFLDHRRFVDVTGAGFVRVHPGRDVERSVREAFHRARAEARPIVLNVPRQVALADYLGDPDRYQPTDRQPAQRIVPDPDLVEQAARLIARSRRPVMVLGTGATASEASEAATRLGERIGALYATTLPNRSGFESPWLAGVAGGYATRAAQTLFARADLVIGVGASMNRHTLGSGRTFPAATVVHIDSRPPYPLGTGEMAPLYLQADAATALGAIVEALGDRPSRGRGYRTAAVRKALAAVDSDPATYPIEPGTLDPRVAARVIDDCLPAEVGVVCGLGHQAGFVIPALRKRRPVNDTMTGFGCIGNALPAAIGAATAIRPGAMVAFEGDAGALMNVAELDTAGRIGVTLMLVVMNDEGLGAEYWDFAAHDQAPGPATIPSPDLAAVGRAFGGRGRIARTVDQVAEGVRDFLARGGVYVLDVRVAREVPSVIVRRNYFGEPI